MKNFRVGSRWIIYADDVPQTHIVTRHENFDGMPYVITECDGQETQWLPPILEWIADVSELTSRH